MTSSTKTAPNGTTAVLHEKSKDSESVASAVSNADSEYQDAACCGYTYINPFTHQVPIDNGFQLAKIFKNSRLRLIQIYVLTLLLVPLRAVGCVISLITAWMFAYIGLYGLTLDDLKEKPLEGWRKKIKCIVAMSMRMVYASGSFHYITFKGKRASPKEAPVLVVAPHSSYIDSIIVVACGPPSIVAKHETSQMPLLGKIINYSQPIYVQRGDPNSRQNTIQEIINRARSEKDWPQVAIFPEGTCTNRSALIRFKPGAFFPGVPVQPVLLKYPNRYDTFTWTWDGPGILRLLWLTMAQFYNRCEIEYLPVYVPNEEEKKDANLFAKNVRRVMATALDVPTSEYSFEDVLVMDRAKTWKIPMAQDIVEVERKLFKLGLLDSNREIDLIERYRSINRAEHLDGVAFAELIKVDINDTSFHHLFCLLDPKRNAYVSLKKYLIIVVYCKMINDEPIKFLRTISPLFSEENGRISRTQFKLLLKHASKIKPEQIDIIFFSIDSQNKGLITFDEFELYVRELPQYKYLFKKLENVRRVFNK